MEVYYPALLSSAIFFGGFVIKTREKDYKSALFICLFAIPSIIFLAYLSKRELNSIAYTLILVPVILVYVGYTLGIQQPQIVSVALPPSITRDSSGNIIPGRIEPSNYANMCDHCKRVPCKCRK